MGARLLLSQKMRGSIMDNEAKKQENAQVQEPKTDFRMLLEKRTPGLHLSEQEESAFVMDDEKLARIEGSLVDIACELDSYLTQTEVEAYADCDALIEAKDPSYNDGRWYWDAVVNGVYCETMTAAWILKELEDEEGVYHIADKLTDCALEPSCIESVLEAMEEEEE